MHLIKSGFKLELIRFIRHVYDFIFTFPIELIRLIIKSITSVLGLNLKCPADQTNHDDELTTLPVEKLMGFSTFHIYN